AKSIVALEVAHRHVVDMHVAAGFDVLRGEADDLVVALHRLSLRDIAHRNLVARRHPHAAADVFLGDHGARGQRAPRDNDVVGTRSVIAAVGSRKHPTTSMSTFASARNTQGLCVKASTQAANASVTCATVRSQPKMDAAATMNRTAAVVSMVSMVTLTSRRQA